VRVTAGGRPSSDRTSIEPSTSKDDRCVAVYVDSCRSLSPNKVVIFPPSSNIPISLLPKFFLTLAWKLAFVFRGRKSFLCAPCSLLPSIVYFSRCVGAHPLTYSTHCRAEELLRKPPWDGALDDRYPPHTTEDSFRCVIFGAKPASASAVSIFFQAFRLPPLEQHVLHIFSSLYARDLRRFYPPFFCRSRQRVQALLGSLRFSWMARRM